MNSDEPNRFLITFAEGAPYTTVDLSTSIGFPGTARDLSMLRITGSSQQPFTFSGNLSDSLISDADFSETDFTRCDIKDTLVRDSLFAFCKFDGGSFATTYFERVTFSECTFAQAGITDTQFIDCAFHSCNLSNLLAKGCRLINCRIINCRTNNKLLETSSLFDCQFVNTELQIQTVLENFGLTESQLRGCDIRDGRPGPGRRVLSVEEIRATLDAPGKNFIERLRLHYFLEGELLSGSEYLDEAVSAPSWRTVARVPTSFGKLLSDTAEFLVFLYERSLLTAHAVLKLHSTIDLIRREFERQPEFLLLFQSTTAIHVTLSRIVEQYLFALSALSSSLTINMRILANGPPDTKYFSDILGPYLEGTDAEISEVRPHNSPVEIFFRGLTQKSITILGAIFLASRTQIELIKITPSRDLLDPADSATIPTNALFAMNLGFLPDAPNLFGLRMRSLLPGSMLLDLRLTVNTKEIGKLRKYLAGILK